MTDFDWRTETTRKGTVSRLGIYVHGECGVDGCIEVDPLLYDSASDDTLMCADHSRKRAKANPREEKCDAAGCGAGPAWRDPITGKNEFFCGKHHAENGTVFQDRWTVKAREGRTLGMHKAVCDAAGYGTDCGGEIKWRSSFNRELCNKHAGRVSVGPAWHQ